MSMPTENTLRIASTAPIQITAMRSAPNTQLARGVETQAHARRAQLPG